MLKQAEGTPGLVMTKKIIDEENIMVNKMNLSYYYYKKHNTF